MGALKRVKKCNAGLLHLFEAPGSVRKQQLWPVWIRVVLIYAHLVSRAVILSLILSEGLNSNYRDYFKIDYLFYLFIIFSILNSKNDCKKS